MRLSDAQQERIKRHEGFRLEPYLDSVGKMTVGYGRNLADVPFTRAEVELMFQTDIRRAEQGAENFAFYEHLNDVRKGIVIEMVFQLGARGVGRFVKFRAAAMCHQWKEAAAQMKDSKWHSQTPKRCEELANIFEKGEE